MRVDLNIDRLREQEESAYYEFMQLREDDDSFAKLYSKEEFPDWYNDVYLGGD